MVRGRPARGATLARMTTRRSSRSYRFIGWVGTRRLVTRLHPYAFRLAKGRGPFGRLLGMEFVIVHTTGRTSGRAIDVPLFATPDADRYVLIASNGGRPREPHWAANLRIHPEVEVRAKGSDRPMRARELDGEERERAWTLAAAVYPGYDDYARWWAPMRVPVFALEPRA
jgi:deazaflavin-dependent oxidoreductase (nitroreductase family)